MTEYALANLSAWALKTEKRTLAVLRQSVNDVIKQASQTAVARSRGGSLRKGFVPRDTGTLAASLVSTLYGSASIRAEGEAGYRLAIVGMEIGDRINFGWTADYAEAVHYGTSSSPGWYWIDNAVNDWQRIVDAATARAIAKVQG